MRGLNHQLKQLCRHNREGSFGTQVQRERELTLIANQLHGLGYRCMNQRSRCTWVPADEWFFYGRAKDQALALGRELEFRRSHGVKRGTSAERIGSKHRGH